jgi:hypothetical protein
LTVRSILALCKTRETNNTGIDHGYYRGNLAVGARNCAG